MIIILFVNWISKLVITYYNETRHGLYYSLINHETVMLLLYIYILLYLVCSIKLHIVREHWLGPIKHSSIDI